MAERIAPKLVEVDENFVAPSNPSIQDKQKAAAANFIKEGRKRERKDAYPGIAASVTTSLKEAHAAELQRVELQNAREERKHGRFRFYQGAAAGICIGLVGACLLLAFVVVPFNQQTRASTEAGVMIGVASQQQTERGVQSVPYSHGAREPQDAPE